MAIPRRRRFPACLLSLVLAALLFWTGCRHPGLPGGQPERVDIVIFHTNDIHGDVSGAASLATLLKSEPRPHLWIDSGDWFQGTPEGNLTKGEAVIDIFNALDLTASAIGNHDYDYGEENLISLKNRARFPMLGANILSKDTGRSPGYAQPYILKKIPPGITVGIFGLNTPNMPSLAFPEHIRGLTFASPLRTAQEAIAALRAQGAQVIIAATHLGIEEYRDKHYDDLGDGDLALVKAVPGIDLVLGGHTHTQMTEPVVLISSNGRRTLITQTRGSLSHAYRIVLNVDARTGRVIDSKGELLSLDPARYAPDPEIEKTAAGYKAKVAREMSRVIGSSLIEMRRRSNGESLLGNWMTDVLRRYGRSDIGLTNTFGIREDLPQGPITYGHVYQIMPFDNRVVTVEIRGSELTKLVEKNLGRDTVFLQYSGLKIVYDPQAPEGRRLKSLKVNGRAVVEEKIYTLTTTDFVAQVDRAFKGIERRVSKTYPMLYRDLLAREVSRRSPLSAKIQGRLRTGSVP